VVLEVGIAGWALGYGALWLLVMTVVVTVADTIWGVFQRRVPADIAGLEVGLALAVMVVVGADAFPRRSRRPRASPGSSATARQAGGRWVPGNASAGVTAVSHARCESQSIRMATSTARGASSVEDATSASQREVPYLAPFLAGRA
jgi:hypothetical protein